jgi:hypothetical protein
LLVSGGRSSVGFQLKNPYGFSMNPTVSTGMMGKSCGHK